MHALNSEQHVGTGLIVEPFGDDGAMRFVPTRGSETDRAFILDAPAVRSLAAYLSGEES